jgi:hypothetical protein
VRRGARQRAPAARSRAQAPGVGHRTPALALQRSPATASAPRTLPRPTAHARAARSALAIGRGTRHPSDRRASPSDSAWTMRARDAQAWLMHSLLPRPRPDTSPVGVHPP